MVTGSGTGIGRAVAAAFAREGASVVILGRRREPLEEAAAALREEAAGAGAGATVTAFPGVDVADEGAVTGMFESLSGSGVKLDVLVNNAGVSGPVTCFANADPAEFGSAVDIHLTGTFWVSRQALSVMGEGGRIITISTFFTEERPLEQRPYRFRDPYTAAQGAKNRLAEALSWELRERGIISIATNPGPVHSDRIYKTVYPKAAAEFMRVGGFEGLEPAQVEQACRRLVPLLGEDEGAVSAGISGEAARLAGGAPDAGAEATLRRLLDKVRSVAERIQANTSGMIPDGQFLSQEQVAATVLALAGPGLAGTLNGRVVPADRVFYPVRAHVANAAPASPAPALSGRSVVIAVDAAAPAAARRAAYLAAHAQWRGATPVCLVSGDAPAEIGRTISDRFHSHSADLGDPAAIGRWFSAASANAGPVAAAVHVTGDVPDSPPLASMSRAEWDLLVDRFVKRPAAVLRCALEHFVPGGGSDPRLYKGSSGRVAVVVGPSLPAGKKVHGARRARAEIFRGALRPLAATVNQELSDVLGSGLRAFVALPGAADGREPDDARLADAFDYFLSPAAPSSGEVVFCVDESRKA